jgi:hypothetical protein
MHKPDAEKVCFSPLRRTHACLVGTRLSGAEFSICSAPV